MEGVGCTRSAILDVTIHEVTLFMKSPCLQALSLLVLLEARRAGLRLVNASGGANGFKRQRGARSTVEFNAVFVEHLPWWRRLPWLVMAVIGKLIKIDKMLSGIPSAQRNAIIRASVVDPRYNYQILPRMDT